MTVRLRPTGPQDVPFVTRLERDAENAEIIGQWTDEEHLAAIRGEKNRSHRIIERDGKPAGYLIAYDCRAATGAVYLKRVLVGDKARGTGTAAVAAFLEDVQARLDPDFVWLHVYEGNERAQAVYSKLGFERYEPGDQERARLDAAAESAASRAFRMRWLRPASTS